MEAFDYIVVGGGSAGCVLAARLSERAEVTVCLLEAGGRDRHPFYHIPAGFAKMTKGIGSWGWSTVPQRHLGGRSLRFTQARVIGGGSTINAQIYTRGHPADYDEWRQLGCTGWGFDEVLPAFVKAEDNDSLGPPFHGKGGPLGVSRPRAPLPVCEAFFAAAEQAGLPRCADLAGENPYGAGFYQLTQRDGRRSSAAQAYLRPARGRANLTVRTGVTVRRLRVEGMRATGVETATGSLRARRGVVLAAGAIGSPRLLMLSGIGPADHLREVGVPVTLDLPGVGSDLQDHLDLFAIAACSGPHSYDRYARLPYSALAALRYLATRRGPAASSLFETGGFGFAEEGARSPDIQFHLGLGSGIEAGVAGMASGGITLNSCYLRPRSRGTVRLASADPAADPLIDPNYWEDPHDRRMALRGLDMARDILSRPALRPFLAREALPGAEVRTEKDLTAYAHANAKTDHHPAGTCRMGSDPAAVVDPRLRLNGVEGLRVADASIMPRLISSNTNAATIMIAERAAEMILADDR